MRNHIGVGSWSIGENGAKTFWVDDSIVVSQDFIDSYQLDESDYSILDVIEMPNVMELTDWVSRRLIPYLKDQTDGYRKHKYQKKVDDTAYRVWEFLKKQDPEKLVTIS